MRTDRTRRDVVIAFTDDAPERLVMQPALEGPPLSPETVVGVCTLGYSVSVDRTGPVAKVAVRAVVDTSRRTIKQRAGHHCIAPGADSLLRAHLSKPLVGATIVDSANGTTVPVFDGSTLLRPTAFPASVKPDLQWPEQGGWNFGYSDGFHQPPGISISLFQGYTSTPHRADGLLPVRSVTINGHPAAFLATGAIRALQWTNGPNAVLVILQPISPTGPDDALDPVLIAFASGLR